MFDPMTVAHEIKYPWVSHSSLMKDGSKRSYREAFITIWHVDPCRGGGPRADDSCGWFRPRIEPEERETFSKIARQEYSDVFGKQAATAEGKDYAYVCFEPSCYDAIYWSWRRIAHELRPAGPWKFGTRLRARELEEIYVLSANPIDNLRMRFSEIRNVEDFVDFFMLIYGCYKRFHRPWYQHPRWHLWHWRIQVHPWQKLRRWLLTRCEECGKRFAYGEAPTSHSWHHEPPKFLKGERGLYHADCSGHRPAGQATVFGQNGVGDAR